MDEFIPDNQFVPDEERQPSSEPVAPVSSPDFIPENKFVPDEEKFGTAGQTSLAVLEALGRGAAGGLFTGAEIGLGAEPKNIAGRQEQLGTAGDIALQTVGFVAPAMLTSGVSALAKAGKLPGAVSSIMNLASKFTLGEQIGAVSTLATAGIEGKVARLAAKYGIEGALLSVSDDVSRKLISDKPEDASQVAKDVISHSLLSGIVGAGLGAAVGKISPLWSAKEGSIAQEALEKAQNDAAGATAGPIPAESTPISAKPPTSVAEIQEAVSKAALPTEAVELPQKQALIDAEKRLAEKSKYPAHELQTQSLENKNIRDQYGIFKESGTKEAQSLLNYEALQKREAVEGVKKAVEAISPNPTSDATKGGRKAIELLRDSYTKAKDGLEGFFEQFDDVATNPVRYAGEVTGILEKAIPGIEDHLSFSGIDGKVTLDPWRSTMPFTKETHEAAQQVLNAINEENLTLGKIRNARGNLDQYINYITGSAKTNAEVSRLKSSLMSFIENEAQKIAPELPVRDSFRAYAINEQNRETLERILGGKLFGEGVLGREIVAEDALRKIFATSVTTQAAKDIAGEKQFNSILADYLSQAMESVTDRERNGFSSNKFATFLKNKGPELETALADKAALLQEIRDWTTKMRILPDAPSVNPSGTAKTLMGLMKDVLKFKNIASPGGIGAHIGEYAKEKYQEKQAINFLNDVLSKKTGEAKPGAAALVKFLDKEVPANAAGFKVLKDYYESAAKGSLLIERAVHGIFDKQKFPNISEPDQKRLDKLDTKLQDISRNPNEVLNIGGELGHYAPEQVMALTATTSQVANYLNNVRPQPKINGVLDKPIPVSTAQQNQYNRTLKIAENPLMILKHINDGTLHSRDMKDFQGMYPDMYSNLVSKITKRMMDHTYAERNIPYKTRKALSIFTAMPLDSSFKPQAIQAAQATYQPQQQPQSSLPQMAKKSSRKSQLPSLTETDQQRRMLKQ